MYFLKPNYIFFKPQKLPIPNNKKPFPITLYIFYLYYFFFLHIRGIIRRNWNIKNQNTNLQTVNPHYLKFICVVNAS